MMLKLQISAVLPVIKAFVESQEACTALGEDIGSKKAASLALEDLLAGMGHVIHSRDAWTKYLEASGVNALGKKILIIPPNTHPIALVYPLAIALASGRTVSLRLNRGQAHSESFTRLLVRRLWASGIHVELLSPDFRLENLAGRLSESVTWDAIMVFGDNSTISKIRALVPEATRIIGHGEAITVSIADYENLDADFPAILRDTFSLMQRGCMSSRLLAVMMPSDIGDDFCHDRLANEVAGLLQKHWWSCWGEPLPDRHRAGLILRCMDALEAAGAEAKSGVTLRWLPDGLPALQVATNNDPADFGPQLKICPVPFRNSPGDLIPRWKKSWPQIKLVTLPPENILAATLGSKTARADSLVALRPLGQANRPPWDGLHFGAPIFKPTC